MAGWGCPISVSAVQNSSPCWQLAYKPPTSASAAKPMTFCIVEHSLWMAPLVGTLAMFLVVGLLDRQK
eukprot:13961495-Ditylum_brightwellii.AAC.1